MAFGLVKDVWFIPLVKVHILVIGRFLAIKPNAPHAICQILLPAFWTKNPPLLWPV